MWLYSAGVRRFPPWKTPTRKSPTRKFPPPPPRKSPTLEIPPPPEITHPLYPQVFHLFLQPSREGERSREAGGGQERRKKRGFGGRAPDLLYMYTHIKNHPHNQCNFCRRFATSSVYAISVYNRWFSVYVASSVLNFSI